MLVIVQCRCILFRGMGCRSFALNKARDILKICKKRYGAFCISYNISKVFKIGLWFLYPPKQIMSPAELSRIIFSLCINIFKCVKHTVHSKLRWLEVIFKVLDFFKKKMAAQRKGQDWHMRNLKNKETNLVLKEWQEEGPNRMNLIQMMSRNVICGIKFGRFWTFDLRWPSWILRQMKNYSAGLYLGSSSMPMPNFVQIGWTRSKCRAEM